MTEQPKAALLPNAAPVAKPPKKIRSLAVIQASDSEIPEALRAKKADGTTWYHDEHEGGVTTRRCWCWWLCKPANQIQMSDFQVLETLGAGSYAPVIKVKKKNATGDIYAMKRLPKANYTNRLQKDLPQRERDTLFLAGHHPNIAYLEAAFETDTYWILVTEFCELGSLNHHLRKFGKPGLPAARAALMAGQVLQGMQHLHAHDIMHRDIKPDNVGVGGSKDEPVGKLIDFGFAKQAAAKQAKTIVGSYGYCAPEIDDARKKYGALQQAGEFYDERVDLYSFGIVVFVMCVGGEADPIWTHRHFRGMLADTLYPLWQCPFYKKLGISSVTATEMLTDSGALETIITLTKTAPADRPRTCIEAYTLPLFTKHPGSVPDPSAVDHSGSSSSPTGSNQLSNIQERNSNASGVELQDNPAAAKKR